MSAENSYYNLTDLDEWNGLQFIQLNVQSLYSKIDSIRYGFVRKSMDVIGITETWLNDLLPSSLVNIDDFYLYRNDRVGRRGGGTCLFVRKTLETVIEKEVLSNGDIEMQEITISGNGFYQKQIAVILVYRPPSGKFQTAYDSIIKYVNEIPNINKKELLIMGDFNWTFRDKTGRGYKLTRSIMQELDLQQCIKVPTRLSKENNTIIDLILTNIHNLYKSGCIDNTVSDHYPIFAIIKGNTELRNLTLY